MGRRDILETVLFDSELIVTIGYLSRHADIPIDDAKELVVDVVGIFRFALYILDVLLRTSRSK